MQSPVPRSRNHPGFLPLPRLGSNGWETPTGASTAAPSPWDDGTHNPYAEMSTTTTTRPVVRPLRLSLLQRRVDSTSSITVNAPESPQPLSPLSPARYSRPEGSALGIIVPPGTPPADALPRWMVDRRSSKQKSRLSGHFTPSKAPEPYPPFDSILSPASPTANDWHGEYRPLVRTPEALSPFHPPGGSRDSFPFDIGAVSGERINTPVEPRMRPRPLPRCSSDDIPDNRLFRVNAWGEYGSPSDTTGGLFALMQGHGEPQSRPRHLPPSHLASTTPSRMPSPPE